MTPPAPPWDPGHFLDELPNLPDEELVHVGSVRKCVEEATRRGQRTSNSSALMFLRTLLEEGWAPHYEHFDREGNAGRTCPACVQERTVRELVREFIARLETQR
jgi:hypothetical protein